VIYDDRTPDMIRTNLDRLLGELTALEARQDESNRPALQIVQLVAVDVQDARDALDTQNPVALLDFASEIAAIATWLAAYTDDHPNLIKTLTALVTTTAADINNATN
jgi:hypothetical protein